MNLENIMLSKRRYAQKATYGMTPLIGNIQNRHIYRDKRQIHGCWGQWGGENGSDHLVCPASFWGDENLWCWIVTILS